MIKKVFILLLPVMCLLGKRGHAQVTPTTTATTNTQAGGTSQQGNGSVTAPDLYSGTVNVNIPIYNYSVDGLDLGVSVSYNTLGMQVNQTASTVGLGWNLNTGAYITRDVHGIPDEITLPQLDTFDNSGNLKYVLPIEPGFWADCAEGGDIQPENEPDDFTLVLPNKTVHFALNFPACDNTNPLGPSVYTISTNPKSDLRIDILIDNVSIFYGGNPTTSVDGRIAKGIGLQQNSYVLSFKVTDEKGNQYLFQRGDYEIKPYTLDNTSTLCVDPQTNAAITYYPTSRWVIAQIITYTGQVINYSYTNFNVDYPYYQDQRVKETNQYTNSVSGQTTDGSLTVLKDQTVMYNGVLSNISKITYPNGTSVNFNYDNSLRCDLQATGALSNITVQSKYDNNVGNSLTYNFNHAYFISNATATEIPYSSPCLQIATANYPITFNIVSQLQTLLRLKLLSISKIGTDQVTTEPYYTFSYNSTALPPRLSPLQDYYGYYNGPAEISASGGSSDPGTATTLQNYASTYLSDIGIPSHTFQYTSGGNTNTFTYGITRSANIQYAQADILTTITNGFGGQTSLTYQNPSLSNPPEWNNPPQNTGYYDTYYDVDVPMITSQYLPPTPSYLFGQSDFDGLCIHTISSSDGYGNNTTTTYNFSGGERFFAGGYFWYPTILSDYLYYGVGTSNVNIEETPYEQVWENAYVTPMDFINGANHGFSSATATTKNANNEILSSQKYTFTNLISNANEIYSGSTPEPANISRLTNQYLFWTATFPRKFFKKSLMGLPIETDEYDNNGNILTKTVNAYVEKVLTDSFISHFDLSLVAFNTPTSGTLLPGAWEEDAPGGGGTTTASCRYSNFNSSIPLLKSTTTSRYFGNSGTPMVQQKNYYYLPDSANNLSLVSWKDSKGDTYNNQYVYFSTTYSFNNNLNPIEHYITYQLQEMAKWLISSANAGTSGYDGTDPATGGNKLLHYDMLSRDTGTAPGFMRFPGIYENIKPYSFVYFDPTMDYCVKYFTLYDNHNNVLETEYPNILGDYGYNYNGYPPTYNSAIWDSAGNKIATVSNCRYNEMAYTSFEGNFRPSGVTDSFKGNWLFNPAHIVYGSLPSDKAMTGRYYYSLSPSESITCPNIPIVQPASVLSFWCNNLPTVQMGSTLIAMTLQAQVGNWKLYTGYINNPLSASMNTGSDLLTITGNGSGNKIDELRLYPQWSGMATSTYEPLFGISSKCDESNNIIYYEYDAMGRLSVTRDVNGNIISLTKHVIQGSDN